MDKKSDGVTDIREGQTNRRDKHNILWTSTFRILSDTEVEMTSIADPREATDGAALTRPDGTPSLEPVTYTAILKLARKDDRIQMSGSIEYGNEVVMLTMRKTGS
ncbi:MAG: hypothetical protein H6868_10120 [Rhodospirillales bacterium]|nr:hypothetical protein [Rhodospirillales bacterium]